MANNEERISASVLRQLVEELARSDVEELEITDGTSRIYVSREPGIRTVAATTGREREPAQMEGVPIMAPLTGVYYSRPSPDQPPFARVGELIVTGQVVALIETMKLFNEVVAEVTGEVLRLQSRDGDLVEAGHALMYIRPRAEGEAG